MVRRPNRYEGEEISCPKCGGSEFIVRTKEDDPSDVAITCDGRGEVIESTHPLDPSDRPVRRRKPPPTEP